MGSDQQTGERETEKLINIHCNITFSVADWK